MNLDEAKLRLSIFTNVAADAIEVCCGKVTVDGKTARAIACVLSEVERLTRQRDIAWAAMAALKDVLPGWHPTKYMGTEDAETYLAFVARLDKIEAAEVKGDA